MLKVTGFIFFYLIIVTQSGNAQITIDTSRSVEYVITNWLLNPDSSVRIKNLKFTGEKRAVGLFRNSGNHLQMTDGIILATGSCKWAEGPNESPMTGDNLNTGGDFYLSSIAGTYTHDVTKIEFDFIPSSKYISFHFVFGSEEYPEYVGSEFNDVFGFFVSGPGIRGVKNIATLPDWKTPITINNVNHIRNSAYFNDNNHWDKDDNLISDIPKNEIEYDGFTNLLFAQTDVVPGQVYHLKMAIADVSDDKLDSGVFLKAFSFNSHETEIVADKNNPIIRDDVLAFTKIVVQIKFDFDDHSVKDESKKDLDKIYNQLYDPNTVVEIHGHTDDQGTDEYNKTLSLNRANAVAKYLKDKGLEEKRIVKIEGHGSAEPIASNENELGRYENRRVEFIIKTLKPE